MNQRVSRSLAWAAAVVGAVEFAFRAIIRTRSDWPSDWSSPYVAARLWLAGLNPYNPAYSIPTWYAGGAPHTLPAHLVGVGSVYPPPTIFLMVPLAVLRWQRSFDAFVAIGLVLYAAVVYGLVRLGWPEQRTFRGVLRQPAAMSFVAFALGFAPIHSAFHSVNIVLFAACAATLAVVASLRVSVPLPGRRRRSAAGLLVGVGATAAICIKPTTGIFLLPWLVRERRWRWLAGIVAACAIVTAASLAPMLRHLGLSWLPDYTHNADLLFAHGGNADVSAENFWNTDRIDLQLVAFAAFGNRTLAAAAAAVVYLCLLAAFLGRAGWRKGDVSGDGRGRPFDLLLLVPAGCLALGLLPSYSRMYAAIVLLPLVLWCFRHLHLRSARWMLLLLSDFLVNTSAVVRLVGSRFGLIAPHHRLWDFTLGGHTCWLLLAVGVLLVWAIREQTAEDARLASRDESGPMRETLTMEAKREPSTHATASGAMRRTSGRHGRSMRLKLFSGDARV
jgi:hypothetical protein